MDSRIALIGIIVKDKTNIDIVNDLLTEYGQYIFGRMGVPYKQKNCNVISVAIDAPLTEISALSGKLGKLQGITSKVLYAKQEE